MIEPYMSIEEVRGKLETLEATDPDPGASYQFRLSSDGRWEVVNLFDGALEEAGQL